jgi:hypothetical protein
MKTWYTKVVPYPATVAAKQFDDSFRALCNAQGGKANGAAVFSAFDQSTKSTTFYFSPEAKRIAETADAQSCQKPRPASSFSLSIGDPGSWVLHFPSLERTPSQKGLHPQAVAASPRRR